MDGYDIPKLMDSINKVKSMMEPTIEILGLIATMQKHYYDQLIISGFTEPQALDLLGKVKILDLLSRGS